MANIYNVIDLFCCCGGLSKGFEEAGCNILVGVDVNNATLRTFERIIMAPKY